MANAGRVAIVPKGEYNSATAYKRLDLVRYNNAVYVAKKANTGVSPTKTDTWMLCIQNVTQEQYDAIINGTKKVGKSKEADNALKLNGLTAEEFVANENLLINPYFKDPINTTEKTSWTGSSSSIALLRVFNQWNAEASNLGTLTLDASGLTLDKGTSSYVSLISSNAKTSLAQSVGEKFTVSVKANGEVYTYTFTAGTYLASGVSLRTDDGTEILKLFYTSNEWIYFRNYNTTPAVIEWIKLEKGNLATSFIPPNPEVEKLKCGVGEASKAVKADYATSAGTVGGVGVKTDGTRGIPIVSSDYGLMEIGNGLDFHTGKGQDHAIRLSIENGVLVLRDSTSASLVATHSNLAKYLPLTGGTLSGNLTIDRNNPKLSLNNDVGDIAGVYLQEDGNTIWEVNKNDGTSCTLTMSPSRGVGAMTRIYENGTGHTVLHTGNSKKVASGTTAPSDTTSLWYDTTNKILKRYVDGAWQA